MPVHGLYITLSIFTFLRTLGRVYIYVAVKFLSQVILVFLLFLGMVMYANEVPWVPETFLARVRFLSIRRSWLRPTEEDVSALRPTPKTPAARERNLWYPGY